MNDKPIFSTDDCVWPPPKKKNLCCEFVMMISVLIPICRSVCKQFLEAAQQCILTLLFLAYAENEQGIFDAILRGHIDFSSDPWPSISSSAKDLVKKMLRADPKERLSAVEVLSKF